MFVASPSRKLLLVLWPILSITLLLAFVHALVLLDGSSRLEQLTIEMMVYVVIVVGIYVFVGNSGIVSFGHIGFMALGAYASAWFTCCTAPMLKPVFMSGLPEILNQASYPLEAGILAGSAVAGGIALLVGLVLMRLSGVAATIATFAFLAVVVSVYGNWDNVTGGASSLSGIPVATTLPVATLAAVLACCVAYLFQISRHGLMLRAARDEAAAARASAINAFVERLFAFVLSAMMVGAGGALYASFLGVLTVSDFYLAMTFLTLAMLIVGGMRSLAGAVVGVMFITVAKEILAQMERGVALGETTLKIPQGTLGVALGIVLILVLILRPAGVMRGKEFGLPGFIAAPKDVQPVDTIKQEQAR